MKFIDIMCVGLTVGLTIFIWSVHFWFALPSQECLF